MTGQPPPTSSPHTYQYPRAMRENGSQQNPYGSRVLGRHRGRERSHGAPYLPPGTEFPDLVRVSARDGEGVRISRLRKLAAIAVVGLVLPLSAEADIEASPGAKQH